MGFPLEKWIFLDFEKFCFFYSQNRFLLSLQSHLALYLVLFRPIGGKEK